MDLKQKSGVGGGRRSRQNQNGNRFDETRKKGTERKKGIKIRSSEGQRTPMTHFFTAGLGQFTEWLGKVLLRRRLCQMSLQR